MADYAAASETIWPTQNDIAAVLGDGNKMLENQWNKPLTVLSPNNWTLSGFTVPGSSGTLSLSVALGNAYIAGRHITVPGATSITATASNTNYVFLKLTRDGSNLVTGVSFEVNITGVSPADSIAIATLVAGGSTVTSTSDARTSPGRMQMLTSGTAYVVPAGIRRIYVEVFGASGGGGGGGGSGVSPTAGTAGGAGGTTTFDALSVTGGGVGTAGVIGSSNGVQGAAHGVGSGGTHNRTGGGSPGGPGGGGGGSASHNGGIGGDGGYSAIVMDVVPDTIISYSIGAAGAAGAAGTGSTGNGAAGRAGTAGLIVIHY
jgi:hypothetical protein